MFTELSVVEQRYLAVRDALDGAKVIDVAIIELRRRRKRRTSFHLTSAR